MTVSTIGIGDGIAWIFAWAGALVVVHGTREATAREVVADIVRQNGRVVHVLGSLGDPETPDKIVQGVIIDQCGRIDGVVNNAADMTRGSLDRTIAINLRPPFLLIQAALPHFRRQGTERVLNIGSIDSYCGESNLLGYSISKGGLVTLTRNLADAYGPEGIRVNLFNVGWTRTPNEYELKKMEGLPENWPSRVPKAFAPSGRLLAPEDIAWAAVYFMSDEASLINGTTVDLEQYPLIGRNPVK